MTPSLQLNPLRGLPARSPRRPISVARLEVVIARAVALFGLLFGAQAMPVALGQREQLSSAWWLVTIIALYGCLVTSGIASVVRRGTMTANAAIAVVFLLALIFWVPAVTEAGWSGAERPWLWFMITVATAAAAVAFPVWLATLYLLITPALYGILRLTEFGGAADVGITTLDVVFAVLLGGAVLVIITMLRQAAAAVDGAQATALSRYLDAVAEHAREVERVQVDAIVHDTVLSAFLSAGRAETEEQRLLAATLAQNAIVHLKAAEAAPSDDDSSVPASDVAQRITEVYATMRTTFALDLDHASDTVLPPTVAESMYAATLQAMINSIQHAGTGASVRRWVSMTPRGDGGISIAVGDSGVGFIVDEIPEGRLGVRVSIIERMTRAGGEAIVESTPGEGSLVRIEWPAAGFDPAECEEIENDRRARERGER
jgi:signal transduction histidine kinase